MSASVREINRNVDKMLWSGPGRALQVHLDTFAQSASTEAFIRTNTGRPVPLASVPKRLDAWLHFARSYSGTVRLHGGLVEGMTAAAMEDLDIPIDSKANVSIANSMALTEYRLLNSAVTHYVSLDMMNLISNAAHFAVPEPLFPTDIPSESGMIVFEFPLVVPDLHPVTGVVHPLIELPVRGFGWIVSDIPDGKGTTKKGIYLLAYTDATSYSAIYNKSLGELRDAEGADWELRDLTYEPTNHLLGIEFNPWGFGTVWGDSGPDIHAVEVESHDLVSTVAYQRRWMLSFFRLIWQQILSPEPYAPTRAERHRADRLPFTQRIDNDVKVLRLRRIATDVERTHEEREHGWTLDHRIIVRPHWRRQFYPSLGEVGDPAAYRMVWIQAFVKGPEGTPLVVKHNVTAVVR